mgnify:CR=1 FL=1
MFFYYTQYIKHSQQIERVNMFLVNKIKRRGVL